MTHIHLDTEFNRARREALQGSPDSLPTLLSEFGGFSEGEEPPTETTIIIGGRPKEQHLDLPNLNAVIVPFAGIPEATAANLRSRPHIKLYNLHHNAAATAELAVGLLLAAARRIVPSDRDLRKGVWETRYHDSSGVQLTGKTACILGYGEIGRRIGNVLHALGMNTIGVRRTFEPSEPSVLGQARLHEALKRSHALVISAPLTEETKGLIGAAELGLLQKPCLFVNVGRGLIVDELALFEACRDGMAAGIDVWYQYPKTEGAEPVSPSQYPFHELENVVLSPHQAGSGDAAEELRASALVELVGKIVRGAAVRAVDVQAGY